MWLEKNKDVAQKQYYILCYFEIKKKIVLGEGGVLRNKLNFRNEDYEPVG